MPLPAIAAVIARVAVPVGRALLGGARGVGAAAKAVGTGALDAGKAVVGSFRAAPAITRSMLGRPQQPMAAAARSAQSGARAATQQAVRQTVNVNTGGGGGQSLFGRMFRPTIQVPPTGPSQVSPVTNAASGGRSWTLPSSAGQGQQGVGAQAAQAARQGQQQPSLANRAAAAQQGPSRWMQRGAALYDQVKHDAKRDNQRDWIDFNKNLAAGAEGLKRFDPKALAFYGKAAGLGMKMLAGVLTGPVGAVAAFVSFPKLVHGMTSAVIENRRALGQVNATYARTLLVHDRDQRLRRISFAAGTQTSFREMVKATNQLEKSLQPFTIASSVVLQKLLTILTQMATTQSEAAKSAAEYYGLDLKAFEDEAKQNEIAASRDVQLLLLNLKKLGGDRNLPPIPAGGR